MTTAASRPWSPKRETERPRSVRGISLGRIFGVQIVADWSLLVIFALVLVQLGVGVLPRWHPEWSGALVWSVATIAAVLFFASILVHELSHALVARLHGIRVPRITLFLFGGMAHMESEPRSPRAELLTAGVGPIVSLAIGVAGVIAGAALSGGAVDLARESPTRALAAAGPIATLFLWLGPVNIILAVFNLIPGFPLDGGRVLRAFLWWTTGDLLKATRWASLGGTAVGLGLVALGLISIVNGDIGSGIWIGLIGWFLAGAARQAYKQLAVRHALDGVPLEVVMDRRPDTVSPETTIDELVHEHLMVGEQRAFPVLRGEELVGLVTATDVRKVPANAWHLTAVSVIMMPTSRLVTLDARANASDVLEKLAANEIDQVPIVDGTRLHGMVRRSDVLKWLAIAGPR